MIYSDTVIKLIRKQGIGWIRSINRDIHVNMENVTIKELKKYKMVIFEWVLDLNKVLENNPRATDQDFCLFRDFPFRKLVFISGYFGDLVRKMPLKRNFTCTELWLYQYNFKINTFSKSQLIAN